MSTSTVLSTARERRERVLAVATVVVAAIAVVVAGTTLVAFGAAGL